MMHSPTERNLRCSSFRKCQDMIQNMFLVGMQRAFIKELLGTIMLVDSHNISLLN